MSPALRSVVALLAVLTVWLVAWPASAAAPLCDDRAASSLAPAPTLDPPNASVDIGMGPDACGLNVEPDASFHQGRSPKPMPSPASSDLMPVHARALISPRPVSVSLLLTSFSALELGVRGRVDRPPRA